MTKYTLAETAQKLDIGLLDLVALIREKTLVPESETGIVYFPESAIEAYVTSLNPPEDPAPKPKATKPEPLPEPEPKAVESAVPTGTIDDLVEQEVVPQKPVVTAPELKEEWYAQASKIYGDKLDDIIDIFNDDVVKETITHLLPAIGYDATKALLQVDVRNRVFSGGKRKRMEYAGKVAVFQQEIQRKYGANVPKELNILCSPTAFLPHKINNTETSFYESKDLAQPHSVRELSVMLGYNQSLIHNLQEEGFDVLYLDSMVRKGLHLDGSKPHMGGRPLKRINWRRNTITGGLKPLDQKIDMDRFTSTEKKLSDACLIQYDDGNKNKIVFPSNWSDYAEQGSAIRDYLEGFLVKK